MTGRMIVRRKPPKSQAQGKVMQDEIRTDLTQLFEAAAIRLESAVEDWTHPPEFKVVVQSGPTRITGSITVANKEEAISPGFTVGAAWDMVDSKGRRGGTVISSSDGGYLRFQSGYARQTNWPGQPSYPVGPGERFGPWNAALTVEQGEVVPLHITEGVKQDVIDPVIDRRIRAAYRRAFRKVTGRAI